MNFYGLETTPVVVDGVMYVTGNNQVDAISGVRGGRSGIMSGQRAWGRRSQAMPRLA